MDKFYTRSGDDGTTGFLGEGRLSKDDIRFETLGTLDECSAHCGVIRAQVKNAEDRRMLEQIQRDLYHIMAETAADLANAAKFRKIGTEQVDWVESQIDRLSESVKMPQGFILPGETLLSADVSVARTVVRRAERRLKTMMNAGLVENQELLHYLNRLSSLLFILEVKTAQKPGRDMTIAREKNV